MKIYAKAPLHWKTEEFELDDSTVTSLTAGEYTIKSWHYKTTGASHVMVFLTRDHRGIGVKSIFDGKLLCEADYASITPPDMIQIGDTSPANI